MFRSESFIGFLLLMSIGYHDVSGARILGIFPHPGISHFALFKPLLENLASRGHSLTVLTHFPRSEPLANYTDISLEGTVEDINNQVDLKIFENNSMNIFKNVNQLYQFLNFYEPILKRKEVTNLVNEKFDLIIIELFNTDIFLGLAHRIGAPFVGISSSSVLPWGNARFANPDNPAYIPNIFSPCSDSMTFIERVLNTFKLWYSNLSYKLFFEPYSQQLAEKYFGPIPPLSEIAKNTTLLLLNTHFSLHRPKPLVPAVIEVGGIHIKPLKKLPANIQHILDSSKDGVIYFSMGSMLRGETLPAYKRDAFLKVFSKLNQTVLWKWEGDLPNKPKNVHVSSWFPQRDILEHKNVVLFISHGGLLGASEAAYCGVPMICIPMYGDQEHNSQAIVQARAGIKLGFGDINEENLQKVVTTILTNPEYRRSARNLAKQYRDRPVSAMDTAVFWIEYVIRHQGAPHLQSKAADLPFYTYYLLDVIAFFVVVVSGGLMAVYYLLRVSLKAVKVGGKDKKKMS